MTKKASLLAAYSVTTFSARTQDTNPDTLVVTTSRFEQPRSTAPAPTTVVTRQDIGRQQSTSVNDVLCCLPGVDITQNGGSGQLSSTFIRGTNASHVLVLIGGAHLNPAGVSGSTDPSQPPITLVQHVEYIRGSRSAVYGSDAISGVVNIITTRDEPEVEISTGQGSNSYQNYDISIQQQLGGKTRVTLLDDCARTHGYDVVAYGNTRTQAQTDNDGSLSKALYGALGHDLTDAQSDPVRGYGYDNRTNYNVYYSPGSLLPDTRKLYSQSWDTGLHYSGKLIRSQLITDYSHSKDYSYDPHYGRYDSSATLDEMKQYTVQQTGNVIVGRGSTGADVDWQKQTATSDTGYARDGYDQCNISVHLAGL